MSACRFHQQQMVDSDFPDLPRAEKAIGDAAENCLSQAERTAAPTL